MVLEECGPISENAEAISNRGWYEDIAVLKQIPEVSSVVNDLSEKGSHFPIARRQTGFHSKNLNMVTNDVEYTSNNWRVS